MNNDNSTAGEHSGVSPCSASLPSAEQSDIGLHFGNALADGRYAKWTPSWERREYQRVPTDPPPKMFGGQIPMDEPNADITGGGTPYRGCDCSTGGK